MMIEQYGLIALKRAIPGTVLEAGDSGTVLEIYGEGAAYEVEFVTEDGGTAALLTLKPEDIIPVGPDGQTWRSVGDTSVPHVTLTPA
jgi:hypothetical protein